MIDLEKSYIATEHEGSVYFYFECKCETCGQRYNNFSLNLSIFLYDAVILTGHNSCCFGFTCLSCLRTNLLKGNSFKRLKQDLDFFMGPNGSHLYPDLRYYSPVPFPPEHIPELKDFNIISWYEYLSEDGHIDFQGSLNLHLTENPDLEEEFLCSYINDGEKPIGTIASLLWFKPEQVEALVQIENDYSIRIFPRYIHKMSWRERYDSFCWQYKLYQDYLAGLKVAAIENFTQLREYARQNNINLDNLVEENPGILKAEIIEYLESQAQQNAANDVKVTSEFLDLLINYDPAPWDVPGDISDFYKDLWKSERQFRGALIPASLDELDIEKFRPKMSLTQLNKMTLEIRGHLTKSHVQEWASEHYIDFIKEYISLACRSDFSYSYVWDLKCRYLKQLYAILDKESFKEAQFAFYNEGPTWTITFKGKTLRGLKGVGFQYINYLVMNQERRYHTNELNILDIQTDVRQSNFDKELSSDSGDSDQHIKTDETAKQQYKVRIKELHKKKEEAKRNNDLATLETAQEEYETILSLLKKDFTPSGKPRIFRDGTHKVKDRIVQAIRRAILSIKEHDPDLADHFRKALQPINNPTQCYNPDQKVDWQFRT